MVRRLGADFVVVLLAYWHSPLQPQSDLILLSEFVFHSPYLYSELVTARILCSMLVDEPSEQPVRAPSISSNLC